MRPVEPSVSLVPRDLASMAENFPFKYLGLNDKENTGLRILNASN